MSLVGQGNKPRSTKISGILVLDVTCAQLFGTQYF
jgi:hypothetical protein